MRKVAFLVANDEFPDDPTIPPLRFTQNDASELGEILADSETCGFETKLYLNETSQKILSDLEVISGELTQDDTLLFYYSGHGRLRGKYLCLVTNETKTASLVTTSVRALDVLGHLQDSRARRRVFILDCCHSGAIGQNFKGGDAESSLTGLAHSFGSYILTASTGIELAEEREKDGHGIFTKALIDCLREPRRERITVDDWYEFAFERLRNSGNQTPLKWTLQVEGSSIEIGNFKQKQSRWAEQEQEQLKSTPPPEPPVLHPPATPTTPKVLPGTGGVGALPKRKKSKLAVWLIITGGLLSAAMYIFAPAKPAAIDGTQREASQSATAKPDLTGFEEAFGINISDRGNRWGGVSVTYVPLGSPAYEAHVSKNDVIAGIDIAGNNHTELIHEPADVTKIMEKLKSAGKKAASLMITDFEGEHTRWVALPVQ
jgi:Caspase domain